MSGGVFFAIDLGAESGRGMLGFLRDGRLEIEEISRFPTGILEIYGSKRWNVYRIYEEIVTSIEKAGRAAAARGETIETVAIDAWGVDFALLDANGEVVGLPYSYRDERTKGAMERFFAKMRREKVYALTGCQTLPFNSLYQFEAAINADYPALRLAKKALFIPDLFAYLLTGNMATEFTYATTTQMFNPFKQDWDDDILAALGLERGMLLTVSPTGSRIGALKGKLSDIKGLKGAQAVACATHDTGSAVAGLPDSGGEFAFISSGTWSLMGFLTEKPIANEKTLEYNITNEGAANDRAGTYRALKNITGMWILQQCKKSWEERGGKAVPYSEIAAAAEYARPFAAFIDPDDPAFASPPDMPSAVADYLRKTGQSADAEIGQTARIILESLALKCRFVLNQLAEINPSKMKKIHIIGGGCKNELLCRMTASACKLPVIAGPAEATAAGNLLVQAFAGGKLSSLGEIPKVVAASFAPKRYEPGNADEWDEAYERFVELIRFRARQ